MRPGQPLMEFRGVSKRYHSSGLRRSAAGTLALDDIHWQIRNGQTMALVGESGSGKSTLLRIALGTEEPTTGQVLFKGRPLTEFRRKEWLEFRRQVQPVFQDPWSSLNPRMRIESIVAEPVECLLAQSRRAALARARDVLDEVGIPPDRHRDYPHKFSGGQRQRIAIARALSIRPSVLLLDEPVSALDLSVRNQILCLLADLQKRDALSYLLVSHDMTSVWSLSHEVAVLYRGRLLEIGASDEIRRAPRSPYTRALLDCVMSPDPSAGRPRPPAPPDEDHEDGSVTACNFRLRCPLAEGRCATERPALRPRTSGHLVACHLS